MARSAPALFLVLAVAACSTAPSPRVSPVPVVTVSPTLDPEVAEWIAFRTGVGLQADEAWVRAVAANPSSRAGSDTYEIPLLPEEVAFLQGRNARIEDAHDFGAAYGAQFPDGFAGEAVDTGHGDRLVLLYTRDVELHRLRFTAMPEPSRPEVRLARWSMAELEGFRALVSRNLRPDPRLSIASADIDVLGNHVRVNYSANERALGDNLLKVFGSTGWLLPVWLGPLDQEGPFGSIRITVVDESDEPRSDLPCRYVPLDPDIAFGDGADTNAEGKCLFTEVPAGAYRLDILAQNEQSELVLKSTDIVVRGGETTSVRIVIADP